MSEKRIPLMAANWKMHKTLAETKEFFNAFIPKIKDLNDRDILIAPPFTALALSKKLTEDSLIILCAQNMHWEEKGAFTGEISPLMIKEIGINWVILGHSERRHIFKENDEVIAAKVSCALAHEMNPILCIGEKLEERELGKTEDVLEVQLESVFGTLSQELAQKMTVAYEPVWAIGTGKTATPEIAQETHLFIRSWLSNWFDSSIAQKVRILYGGSVKPENVESLMAQPDIDGVLVGGASLDPDKFSQIAGCKITK